jgi:pimeloyl-ACP methyl ester carboxylesterase
MKQLVEEKMLLSNGVGINVKYSLPSDKETVLFLHFSGGTLEMWNGVWPYFEEEYRIISPDLRGHGQSDKPESGYHIDNMAGDVYLLLKELNIASCHVVGSSKGAEIALSLVAKHPEMVLSIVCEGALYNEFGEYGLFSGTMEEMEQEKERLRGQIAERKVPVCETFEEYLEIAAQSFKEANVWNEHVANFLKSTAVRTEDGRFTSHYLNRVRSEYIQSYWEVRFEEYYKRVQCPILFLPSQEESENEKIAYSMREFSKLVQEFEVYHIENSIHAYVWLQFPSISSRKVLSFIKNI